MRRYRVTGKTKGIFGSTVYPATDVEWKMLLRCISEATAAGAKRVILEVME